MAGVKDVFERHEKKYRIQEEQYRQLMPSLLGYMSPDAYGSTQICSLYLDTPDSQLIERSLAKPLYKEKLRIRSYGLPSEDDVVFIEIKKKFKGVVYKRRVSCTLAAARRILQGIPYDEAITPPRARRVEVDQVSRQIAHEINYLQRHYFMLEPAMFISTWREAYLADDSSGLRVTFDSDIRWRNSRVDFKYGADGVALLAPDELILEVKSQGPIPLWLTRQLSQLHIYPTSFSKYGEAYKTACAAYGALPYGRQLAANVTAEGTRETAFDAVTAAVARQSVQQHPAHVYA